MITKIKQWLIRRRFKLEVLKLEPLTDDSEEQSDRAELWLDSEMRTTDFSPERDWAIMGNDKAFIGRGGINFRQQMDSIGQINLVIDPELRRKGFGTKAVDLILEQAFHHLNLKTVYGECYLCNPAVKFWEKIVRSYKSEANSTILRNRKYWNGKYYDSIYFSIDRDEFENRKVGKK